MLLHKEQAPKVSIIIPVYNVEQYLEECMESVIHQTLKDIEIICVNDASTDQSLDILRRYEGLDERVILINNSVNEGQSFSRNKGLMHAHGKYIYFLDSDDLIVPDALYKLFIYSEEKVLDILCFEASVFYENEQLRKQFHNYSGVFNQKYNEILTGGVQFSLWIKNKDWVASVCRKFWRREYLESNNLVFYEGIVHEDELFSFLAIMGAQRVACLNKQYFVRRLREYSTMTTAVSKKNFIGLFTCYFEIIIYWKKGKFKDAVSQSVADHIVQLGRSLELKYQQIKSSLNTQEIKEVSQDPEVINVYQLFLANIKHQNNLTRHIDDNKLLDIKRFGKIIIYGAGTIAKDVLGLLDRNQIRIYGFAVSDRSVNPSAVMGHAVYNIHELIEYGKEAVILVAVSPKFQQDIYSNLLDLNFSNIVFLS